MYHIVYLTTNKVNLKFYIGVHSTDNLDDGYLGSGDKFKLAITKYGKENFQRKILYYCLSEQDAYNLEEQIVTLDFIKRTNVYNISPGGRGGDVLKFASVEKRLQRNKKISLKHKGVKWKDNEKNKLRRINYSNTMKIFNKTFKHSEETKKKMSEQRKDKKRNPESVAKMALTLKGRPKSIEWKIKMSKNKGVPFNTPFGQFNSYYEYNLTNPLIPQSSLSNILRNNSKKIFNKMIFKYCLPNEWLGKTYSEVGFYFI
jgi:hypothetical protein